MATAKKTTNRTSGKSSAPIVVELPRRVITQPRSRQQPSRSSEAGQQIQQTPQWALLNTSVRELRATTNIIQLLRHLARVEGPFSTAVHNLVETAASGYRVLAYDNSTHAFSAEGTRLAMSIMSQMDTPTDYIKSTQKRSIDSTIKMLLREALLTGMVSSELVLNKSFMADRIQIVGAETLQWVDDGKGGAYPTQEIADADDPVSLDIPTFFYDRLNPDPDTVTPRSMMEACLKVLVYFEEFMEDIRRSVRQAGHNRVRVTLDWEKLAKTAPKDVQKDPIGLGKYMEDMRIAIETSLGNLEPDQAIVNFSGIETDVLETGHGVKVDYTPLLSVVVGQYATSMKTPPSVLGLRLEGGSAQMGSVETLIFLKSAKTLHTPVETVMSRILTLACRLYGADVYVWFKMKPLDLRPENELEAFMTMRQQRLLELLSLGMITDDEFAVEVDCFPRPDGAPDLSGTMFHRSSGVSTSPGDTPMGRDLQPDKDAPRRAGGRSQ